MKTLLIILLNLIYFNLYSQQLTCERINEYSLPDIRKELIQNNKHSIDDSKCFGKELAKQDSLKGTNRILTYYGPNTTGCLKCLYHKFGFETYEFAPNDVIIENIDAFVDSYNTIMKSRLTNAQKHEIASFDFSSENIFNYSLTAINQYKVERLNDSIFNFRMHSDTLEFLFNSDVEYLIIKIGDSINDPNQKELKYEDLKTKGIDIPIDSNSETKLFVLYDFNRMPDRYDLCWCGILEQKFIIVIPLKIKK